jgi:hypothetical protein
VIVSQRRQENFSRTVWITFHCRGTTSSVSVMSSPNLASLPPQQGQALGAAITTRSRGRCAGNGARTGFRRAKLTTDVVTAASSSAALASSSSSCSSHLVEQTLAALGRLPKPVALHLGDQQLQMRHHGLGTRGPSLGLLPRRAFGGERRLQRIDLVWRRHGEIIACAATGAEAPESNRRSLSRRPRVASFAPDCASQSPQAYRPTELT